MLPLEYSIHLQVLSTKCSMPLIDALSSPNFIVILCSKPLCCLSSLQHHPTLCSRPLWIYLEQTVVNSMEAVVPIGIPMWTTVSAFYITLCLPCSVMNVIVVLNIIPLSAVAYWVFILSLQCSTVGLDISQSSHSTNLTNVHPPGVCHALWWMLQQPPASCHSP